MVFINLREIFSYIHPKDLDIIFKTLIGSLPRLLEEIKRQAMAMDISEINDFNRHIEICHFYIGLKNIMEDVLWGFIRGLPTPFKSRKREGPLGLI